MELPPRYSWRVPLVQGEYPSQAYRRYLESNTFWTSQTAVLEAGTQAQINGLSQRADDNERLSVTALIQMMARQEARLREELEQLKGLLFGLNMQIVNTQQQQNLIAQQVAIDARRAEIQSQAVQSALTEQVAVSQSLSNLDQGFEDRALTAISGSGAVQYDDTTGVIEIPTQTGWDAPTGTPSRAAFDIATATTTDVAARLAALIEDLTASNLIGA